MLVREQQKLKATWKIQIRDAKTEKLIREQIVKNLITDNGKNLCAMFFIRGHQATNSSLYWVLVLGTGSGTPSASDTNLWSPVDASEKTGQLTQSGNIAQYWVRYLPEDANGYSYTEAGIYDNIPATIWNDPDVKPKYTHGTLLNHVVIDPAIKKTSDILVDIYIQLQFS